MGGRAAKIIQEALGKSDDVANYVFPETWPPDREQRPRIIGDWLQTEARYLAYYGRRGDFQLQGRCRSHSRR